MFADAGDKACIYAAYQNVLSGQAGGIGIGGIGSNIAGTDGIGIVGGSSIETIGIVSSNHGV